MGRLGEIMTGLLFQLPRARQSPRQWADRILLLACASLFVEMLVAIYVHLQPAVPAVVLPLGIKPPMIPLFVLILELLVAFLAGKDIQATRAPNTWRQGDVLHETRSIS
jgi:hypothetical protein